MKVFGFNGRNKKCDCKQKLFCSFLLSIIVLFSCMFFSACANKFDDLKINVYSSEGEIIEEINFVIDSTQITSSQRIGIRFDGIDKEDVGQVLVYSVPHELIGASNYKYNGNMCYVDINPRMPSADNAKLVVSHLASGKKKEIGLTIDQKSTDLEITNSKYVISIPAEEDGDVEHIVDFSKLLNLKPVGSTDKVYFKIKENPTSVQPIAPEDETIGDVYSGFVVKSGTIESTSKNCVKIYPVTHMNGFINENIDKYQNKVIEIYFKKTLKNEDVTITSETVTFDEGGNVEISLIANDNCLNSLSLTINGNETPIVETDLFEMYELTVSSTDTQKVTAFLDGNNNVVVIANVQTDDFTEVNIQLNPINYVGELKKIEKTVYVKGELKADTIKVKKNGAVIDASQKTNIFDYYEEGNSLGALFTFEPFAHSGGTVHSDLKSMQIVVAPEILCQENVPAGVGYEANENVRDTINSTLYSLEIHKFNDILKFNYVDGKMVSEPFNQDDRIYIKYVKGDGNYEFENFGVAVEIINNSAFENWNSLTPTNVTLNFNRVEGIKSMDFTAGKYESIEGQDKGTYTPVKTKNPQYVYLNRLDGIDSNSKVVYYLQIVDESVIGIDGTKINQAEFEVEVESQFDSENPLKLHSGLAVKDNKVAVGDEVIGQSNVKYSYVLASDENVVCFVFRKNTDVGDYTITFYQEGIVKSQFICKIYEDITSLDESSVAIETNAKAFKNESYGHLYASDYIVASGQELNISVDLPQAVLNSNMVTGYEFKFVVGTEVDGKTTTIDETKFNDYFDIYHEDEAFSSARLKSVKGTHIEGIAKYVFVTVYVKTKVLEDIVTISADEFNTISISFSFFVYEEIDNNDISINHSNLTRYFDEYLGVYYKHLCQDELQIQMDEDLWHYVTPDGANSVRWKIDNANADGLEAEDGVEFRTNEKTATIEFNTVASLPRYSKIVRAYVKQFESIFELQCVYTAEKPIISEKVLIKSEISLDKDQNYYINLKNGESYTVLAENFSNKGDVTNPETIIQVFDETGSAYIAREYFDIDQTNGKITVKKVDRTHAFKLVVFAKDALKYVPSSDMAGYNTPLSFIMDFADRPSEQGLYSKAFFVMDIILSDGTEGRPYLIQTADDFWEIDDNELFKKAHYKVMNSISLNSTTDNGAKVISEFEGTIITDGDNIFTFDGITLDENNKNLFVDFNGEIENLKFVVNYNYKITSSSFSVENLGVFDVNNGKLTDVSVVASGNVELNTSVDVYWGLLAAKNYGEIRYTKSSGVQGSISIEGNSTTYLGGLVGQNLGTIEGCEKNEDAGADDVIINMASGRENALSQIHIISSLSGNSVIGGVVGLNSYYNAEDVIYNGIIHNAFVQAVIDASNTSNVGGVIGKNSQTGKSVKFTDDKNGYITTVENFLTEERKNTAIYNVKSASRIVGHNNVGGIVGLDENGLYIECDYQILTENNKHTSIVGNNNVAGIAGYTSNGVFAYCSVMSYCWNYSELKNDLAKVINDVADIEGKSYVGGIVGFAKSGTEPITINTTETEISGRVVVVYSSVNAYLKATQETVESGLTGEIGGILSAGTSKNADTYKSILFNAYFVGRLEGKVNYVTPITGHDSNDETVHYLCLDNNGSSLFNTVYSLNIANADNNFSLKLGHFTSGVKLNITSIDTTLSGWNPGLDYWWGNANINGGYIFVTSETEGESRLPIFDLAPENIKVTVKNKIHEDLDNVLKLYYYDFSANSTLSDVQVANLNKIYSGADLEDGSLDGNKDIKKLLNFAIKPSGLGTVALNVKSSNTNVLDFTYDGKLLINGIGECELIFSSVLNPNSGKIEDRTVKVIVDYPIGDNVVVSESKTDRSKVINSTGIGIAKGTTKELYVLTQGVKGYDFNQDGTVEEYVYKTKENFNLKIEISKEEILNISEYISISGIAGVQGGLNTYTVLLDDKTPFTITTLKKLVSGNFDVKITPYEVVEDKIIPYKKSVAEDVKTEFKLYTTAGITNISFSYDEAIVYPNDTVYLTAMVNTDKLFTKDNINDIYNYIEIICRSDKFDITASTDKKEYFITNDGVHSRLFKFDVDAYYPLGDQVQIVVFRIEFDDVLIDDELYITVNAKIDDYNVDTVNFTVIPQRINKIEIKNYYKGTDDWVLDNILKPSTDTVDNAGRLIIDIAPDRGYYSYLEISDVTGSEEILFIQTDESGNGLSLNYDPSSDQKGIKLYHYAGEKKSRLFVKTQIDKNYSSRVHIIEVRAYSNNGALLFRQTKEIDVKMLPEIVVQYILPDGSTKQQIESQTQMAMDNMLLANGVSADFVIEMNNVNSELEYSISAKAADGTEDKEFASKYELINDVGNHYILRQKEGSLDVSDLNKMLRITFKAYAYLDNGDFEETECYVEFTIVDFVIHGISVNNSTMRNSVPEIYGYYEKPVDLQFYFGKDDISFYDEETENEHYWDTVYTYSDDIENKVSNASLRKIYLILKQLNNDTENNFLALKKKLVDGNYEPIESDKINLSGNTLQVSKGYNKETIEQDGKTVEIESPKYLAVEFKMHYTKSNLNWIVTNVSTSNESADCNYFVVKNYLLNFISPTEWYEPTVVHNENDFRAMVPGGRYILAKDLELYNYEPLDLNLVEFDGNGRTITIQSFASFKDEEVAAGLFKQVYENMIVKNVVVKYQSIIDNGLPTFGEVDANNIIKFTDLCPTGNNIGYSSLRFGGIAATNNGIITNCETYGVIALKATTIEQKKFASGGNYEINFFAGGVVAENSSTGYITNSTNNLSIYAQANVGGFAYKNEGKIVSCSVEEDTTIYGYNTELDKTIIVKIAGFVVENLGDISMSSVNLNAKTKTLVYNDKYGNLAKTHQGVVLGKMSAKDISAGFVYSNAGKISDSFVAISETGLNNNTFSGFVYSNSGTILRAFTYVNGGEKQDNNDSMFAPSGTLNLSNCIEIIVHKSGYTNGITDGLTTIDMASRSNIDHYINQGFAFGDNVSAVWTLNGDYPQLVSTQEKVQFKRTGDYDGLLPLIGTEEESEDGVTTITYKPNFAFYGTRENPYIVHDLKTWNDFFENNSTKYYRIVKNIDFANVGDNPKTSGMTFMGNIQGNNMVLSNVMLYSTETLDSLGLFKNMQGIADKNIKNAVRNLTLTTSSVWASRTSVVGLLAGVVEDFNLYNITIDAEGVIMVGGNAVGGLAGLVRGEFDIDQISSNIGANSTRASTINNYSIYMSKNNKNDISANLHNVYYAGSVAGILDGYNKNNFDINATRRLENNYYMVQNITVNGNVTIIGDTVGGAFGLIGERVWVKNVDVNISGILAGEQYSAGIAGENRGILDNNNKVTVVADNVFTQSAHVSSGIVGFNLGGLIQNVKSQVNITMSGYARIVGGIVGRNVHGTVNNAYFDGQLNAFFTGGIVGVSYSNEIFISATNGAGTLSGDCRINNVYLIPKETVEYTVGGKEIKSYGNVALSRKSLDYMIKISREFYSYKKSEEGTKDLHAITIRNKVLGLVVGMTYEDSIIDKIDTGDSTSTYQHRYAISLTDDGIFFNVNYKDDFGSVLSEAELNNLFGKIKFSAETEDILLKDEVDIDYDIYGTFKDFNSLSMDKGENIVMYLIGSKVASFDTWFNYYSDEFIIVK